MDNRDAVMRLRVAKLFKKGKESEFREQGNQNMDVRRRETGSSQTHTHTELGVIE